MSEPDRSIWKQALSHVRAEHTELWRQWFEDIEPVRIDAGVFCLRAQSDLQQRYLQRDCAEAFSEAAQTITGRLVSVRFLGPDEEPTTTSSKNAESQVLVEANMPAPDMGVLAPSNALPVYDDELVLIPDYSFENFVNGPGNRLALAAAKAIADQPGKAYNPMFIYGGVGLGKTHLLQAICQSILHKHPGLNIVYVSCEDFITRFMDAVQVGQMRDFRHQFRDADVLVLDDIHFLTKRTRTQDEFFHTFNTLHQGSRQIILSSDAAPDQIPHLEERLVSRFTWGMVAEVEPPDYETRVAIIKQKAKIRGVELPDEVAIMVAQRFNRNIRELEGALTKLQMLSQVDQKPITPELARSALGTQAARGNSQKATIEAIVGAVTDFYDVTLSHLQSKRRQRSIALPRQVCMYLARNHTRYSLEEIGGYFGGRDHTTVLHAVRVITATRENDDDLDRAISRLENSILTR